MKNMKRSVALLVAIALLIGCVAGGTIAWLVDTTGNVTNTFVAGNINIDLAETTTEYEMVPGNTIAKDPTVTVVGGSEACWLFVKVTKSTAPVLDTYIAYAVDSDWTPGNGTNGIPEGYYYREVVSKATDQDFNILGAGNYATYSWTDNQVLVKPEVNKDNMDAISGTNPQPTLTFTAAAIQKANTGSVAEAFTKLPPAFTGITP